MMETVEEKQREKLERCIENIPALSTTVCKVMEVCGRTNSSPNELHKIISLDPVLAGQVLRLVNSAYYSFANKITSLSRGIVMLGMNTVKNMALSLAVIGAVNTMKKEGGLATDLFWEHSLAAAVSARLLGGELGGRSNQQLDELFLAGLLHDIGKIPFGAEYTEVLRLAEEEQIPLLAAEQQFLGMDHQQVGALIAEKWQLDGVVCDSISSHHNVDTLRSLGERADTVAIVALGNMYANIYDFGFAGDRFPGEEDFTQLLEFLGCDSSVFTNLGARVEEEIRLAAVFLQV